MTTQQAQALKETFRRFRDEALAQPATSLADMRALGERFVELASEPAGISVEPVDAGGVPCEWITPAGADSDAVLVYLHGGGYILCSAASHRRFVGHLASVIGCRALSVDYRLAPEHPHPAAVNDAAAAYRWLLRQDIDPKRMAIAGDSAGGGLALATLLKLRDERTALPAACVPISPWADMQLRGASMQTRAAVDYLVSEQGLTGMAAAFLQGQQPDPYASPVDGDFAGLPAIYIQVGDEEVLLDDARAVADKADTAGVEWRLDIFPDMQHVFQLAAGNVPEADEAIGRIGDWLKPRLALD